VTILEVMHTNKSINALRMNAQMKNGQKCDLLRDRWHQVAIEIDVVPNHCQDRDKLMQYVRFREDNLKN